MVGAGRWGRRELVEDEGVVKMGEGKEDGGGGREEGEGGRRLGAEP